jgi:hypothetical protein
VESAADAERRRSRDLHELRILAWCVARDKYSSEPRRTDGGRRRRARIVTLTFYVEQEDHRAADAAVSEIEARRTD